MKKTGFTLAEVLITLTIIGVIAAISIPQVITNNNEKQNKAIASKLVYQTELAAQKVLNDYNMENGNFSHIDKLALINNLDESLKKAANYDKLPGDVTLKPINTNDKFNPDAEIMEVKIITNNNKQKEGVTLYTYKLKNNGTMVYAGK